MALNVTVEEFTTPDPITAHEDMMIDELRQLMNDNGIRHLPILRDGSVVGLVSDRDVRVAAGLSAEEKRQVRAADIMATALLSVATTDTLDRVAYAMSEKKVGSAIVMDEDGQLYGIFTATDALNALIEIVRSQSASD